MEEGASRSPQRGAVEDGVRTVDPTGGMEGGQVAGAGRTLSGYVCPVFLPVRMPDKMGYHRPVYGANFVTRNGNISVTSTLTK